MVSGYEPSGLDARVGDDDAARGDVYVLAITVAGKGLDFSVVPCHRTHILGHYAAELVLHRGIVVMEKHRRTAVRDGIDMEYRNI